MKALLSAGLWLVGALGTGWAQTSARDVTYEIFVRAFADSDGDGIGDLNGVRQKLGYLDSLGVGAIWLMPISPSPSYHQYDVTDYRGIAPEYGTLEDFRRLVAEAHDRDIRVVIDLVLNHSSHQHPWFLAARDPASEYRDYYTWETPEALARYGETKEGSADSEGYRQWHYLPDSSERYYGFFSANMPDINYDHPAAVRAAYDIGRFWLEEVGVDGFRLDAARHIFADSEEERSHAFWRDFRAEMKRAKPDVYLVGEVWGHDPSPDVIAPYFEGFNALFNFPLSFAITDAVRAGQGDGLVAELSAAREAYSRVAPDFVDATMLSNHDQNRIMTSLGGEVPKARVAAALLLSLPGQPYVYYGEEIGMRGHKPDEHIREPFPWGGAETTSWLEPRHSVPDSVRTLAAQRSDPKSLYHHYRTWIGLRNAHEALRTGTLAAVDAPSGVVAFRRTTDAETLTVVHNLSDRPQTLKLKGEILHAPKGGGTLRGGTLRVMPYASVLVR